MHAWASIHWIGGRAHPCCGAPRPAPKPRRYFQIPKRLIELAQQQAEEAASRDANRVAVQMLGPAPPVDEEEQQRRVLDRAMEAWLVGMRTPSRGGG